jgi:integration host factor subunit beta
MVKGGASALAKSDLVRAIRHALGLRAREARLVVDRVLEAIAEAVARGDRVELRGIGTFRRRISPGRIARDFRSGRAVRVRRRSRVSFRMSRSLRGALAAAPFRVDAA